MGWPRLTQVEAHDSGTVFEYLEPKASDTQESNPGTGSLRRCPQRLMAAARTRSLKPPTPEKVRQWNLDGKTHQNPPAEVA